MLFSDRRFVAVAGLGLALVATLTLPAAAAKTPKLKVIYDFCALENCADGVNPESGLVADPSGNLYGITTAGGAKGGGTIFELVKGKKGYTFRLIYTLAPCNVTTNDCADGGGAPGPMIVDETGNLYGTFTEGGGTPDDPHGGVIFKVVPGAQSPYHILVAFCGPDGCPSGANPESSLTYVGADKGTPYNGTALLYGATANGGTYGGGETFTLTPSSSIGIVHSFCHYSKHDTCNDGRYPSGALAVSDSGTLYGANLFGADEEPNTGLIWAGGGSQIVQRFKACSTPPCGGDYPLEGVFLDQGGNSILGTTSAGGATGHGIAYAMNSSGKFTLVHPFCHMANCTDGDQPSSTLYADGSGNAYGTTLTGGGDRDAGVLYQIDLATKKYKVLHSFCSVISELGQCSDGAGPQKGVISVGGSLFGVTQGGGNTNTSYGIVYELTP